jgi:hypothetical protein
MGYVSTAMDVRRKFKLLSAFLRQTCPSLVLLVCEHFASKDRRGLGISLD